tara:strand:- start:6152 stop:6622 length:471 start_codon:yes stop_codon:yes gene_type:complete
MTSLATNNVAYVASQLRSNLATLRNTQPAPPPLFSLTWIPVIIDSSAAIAGEFYRWEYTVKAASLEYSSMEFSGNSGLTLLKAYNGWEAGNTETAVAALAGEDPDDLQTGFTVEPVPNGVVVMAQSLIFSDPDLGGDNNGAYYLFSTPNPIGGTCQ